jgi:hypothetical protein
MSGVRKTAGVAAETRKAQEKLDHRLSIPISGVRPLATAAYSYSLEPSLRSSRSPLHFPATQAAQIRRSGLIPYRQDVKA